MSPQTYFKQYINGEWRPGSSEKQIENINPYTEQAIITIPSANEDDLNEAYRSAEQAQKTGQTYSQLRSRRILTVCYR